MAQVIRAFISVDLSDETRQYLVNVVTELAQQVTTGAVRWVRPDRMHLTLRFLGDTQLGRLPDIFAALDDLAGRSKAFSLELDRLGCFPSENKPRVVWAGLSGQVEQLSTLQRGLGDILVPLGWPLERRPFHPHLTLGRVKDSRTVAQAGWPWGRRLEAQPISVTAMHLIESQLRAAGPVYTVRHTSRLITQA